MAGISGLLERIRGKRVEKKRTHRQQFNAYLADIVAGKEVDDEQLAEVLEQLGLTEVDLENEVSIKQQRFAKAAEREECERLKTQLSALTAKHQAAAEAYNVAVARLDADVRQAWDALQNVHNRIIVLSAAEGWLANNVQDHELLEECKHAWERVKELQVAIKDKKENHVPRHRGNIEALKNRIKELEEKKDKARNQISGNFETNPERARQILKEARDQLSTFEQEFADLQKEIARLEAELRMATSEHRALEAKKLIP